MKIGERTEFKMNKNI